MHDVKTLDQLRPILKEEMQKAIDHLKHEFTTLRTGKASASMVDGISAECYGSMMRLKDMAAISTPDARTVAIQPWDKSTLSAIEKAIIASNIGIMPMNDGKVIRLPVPELSEERRKKLAKDAKDMSEQARVSARNVRREANEVVKRLQKDSIISEDEMKAELDAIQKATDKTIASIDAELANKEKDLMSI